VRELKSLSNTNRLGVANSVMNKRFVIAPFAPLAMIEEYAAVVRAVLAGSPAGYDGQVFRVGMVPLDSPRYAPNCPSTWPHSARGCSSWPVGSPTESS
jgi:alkanesulfonate monooxygenase SsuD/methylene tetrahydromethanopterin reductase-like flavin-dependent oxidoreductase (luciferase family)